MKIQTGFTTPPMLGNPFIRYGKLVFWLLVLAWYILWSRSLSADYVGDRYSFGLAALMGLFENLGNDFRWSTQVEIALRILAFSFFFFFVVSVLFH